MGLIIKGGAIVLKTIIILLSIMVGIVSVSNADEGMNPVEMSVGKLCSKLSFSEDNFKQLKGKELVISGSLSSIGDKRQAYLGTNIDFLEKLIISQTPKKDPYGVEVVQTNCTVTCLLSVPGEQCQDNADGELECKQITNPKLEENKRILLKLNSGNPLTVRGVLKSKSQTPQYSTLGNQASIVNFVLSRCAIIKVATDDNNQTE
jgi:hypothetical protein